MNYKFDSTNPDHHREIADAIEAHKEGHPVEVLNVMEKWVSIENPEWLEWIRYRRAPAPVVKWWSEPSHVPCPCWIKMITISLVLAVNRQGIDTINGSPSFEDLELQEATWAPNHLGQFKPCTIES